MKKTKGPTLTGMLMRGAVNFTGTQGAVDLFKKRSPGSSTRKMDDTPNVPVRTTPNTPIKLEDIETGKNRASTQKPLDAFFRSNRGSTADNINELKQYSVVVRSKIKTMEKDIIKIDNNVRLISNSVYGIIQDNIKVDAKQRARAKTEEGNREFWHPQTQDTSKKYGWGDRAKDTGLNVLEELTKATLGAGLYGTLKTFLKTPAAAMLLRASPALALAAGAAYVASEVAKAPDRTVADNKKLIDDMRKSKTPQEMDELRLRAERNRQLPGHLKSKIQGLDEDVYDTTIIEGNRHGQHLAAIKDELSKKFATMKTPEEREEAVLKYYQALQKNGYIKSESDMKEYNAHWLKTPYMRAIIKGERKFRDKLKGVEVKSHTDSLPSTKSVSKFSGRMNLGAGGIGPGPDPNIDPLQQFAGSNIGPAMGRNAGGMAAIKQRESYLQKENFIMYGHRPEGSVPQGTNRAIGMSPQSGMGVSFGTVGSRPSFTSGTSGGYSGIPSNEAMKSSINIPSEAGKFGVYSQTREQLGRDLRRSRPGSRNISLDFNAFKKGSEGGMIVIPNDATEEEVQAAQQYIQGLRNLAKENGLDNYKIVGKGKYGEGIKTSRENGRGVGGFFHTEPGFNTDPKFQKMMSDPEIRKKYVEMMSKTLGNITGARFIAPHNTKGNQGAVMRLGDGKKYSETALAREFLLPELQKIREEAEKRETKVSGENNKKLPEDFGKSVEIGRDGKVDPTSMRNNLIKQLSGSKLIGHVPKDGKAYGIKTGSKEEWANYMMRLGMVESSLKTTTHGDIGKFRGGSRGLFQLSPDDALNHKLKDEPFTIKELETPETNIGAAINIHENLLLGERGWKGRNMISGASNVGRYWGPIKRGWTPGGTARDRNLMRKYGPEWAKQDAKRNAEENETPPKKIEEPKKPNRDDKKTDSKEGVGTPDIRMLVNQKQSKVAGIRKGALQPELVTKLNYAANKVGVEVDVFSGGQRMPGARGSTGTHEHDRGGAADFDIYMTNEDGKRIRLNQDNPAHAKIINKFTVEAARAGIRSAGTDYMGSGATKSSRFHMGISRNRPAAYLGRDSFKNAWRAGYQDFREGRGPENLDQYSNKAISERQTNPEYLKMKEMEKKRSQNLEKISSRAIEERESSRKEAEVAKEKKLDAAKSPAHRIRQEAPEQENKKALDQEMEARTPKPTVTPGDPGKTYSTPQQFRGGGESAPASPGDGGYGSYGRCFV